MNKIKLLISAITISLASSFTVFQIVNWKIKSDYSVKCSIGMNGSTFSGLNAVILFNEEDPERSKITASIDATTINTGNVEMNEHAKEALNTLLFPVITFVSTSITKTNNGYEASGNLTLKGVTKPIKIPFYFDSKKASALFPFTAKEIFKGVITITPKDFSITRKGTPDLVTIELTIPVTK